MKSSWKYHQRNCEYIFYLNGSAITLWNIARIIAYKKNHSKANKSLFRNVNFVEDYETMP
nr:hypothetical protein [Mycoplasmopsis bovis]